MFNTAKRKIKILTDEEIEDEIERRLLELGPYTEEEFLAEQNEVRKDEDPFELEKLRPKDLDVQELMVETPYVDSVIESSGQRQKKLDSLIVDLKSTVSFTTDIIKKFDQTIDTSWLSSIDFEKDLYQPPVITSAPVQLDIYSDKKAIIQREMEEIKKMEIEYLSKSVLPTGKPSILQKIEEEERKLMEEMEKRVKERKQLVQHDLEDFSTKKSAVEEAKQPIAEEDAPPQLQVSEPDTQANTETATVEEPKEESIAMDLSAIAEARLQILQAKEERLLSLLSESKQDISESAPKHEELQAKEQWERNKELDKRIQLLETLEQNEKIREELLETSEETSKEEQPKPVSAPVTIIPPPIPVITPEVEKRVFKGVSHSRIPLMEPISMKTILSAMAKVKYIKDTNLLLLSGIQLPSQKTSYKRFIQEKMMEWHISQAKQTQKLPVPQHKTVVIPKPKYPNHMQELSPSETVALLLSSEKIPKIKNLTEYKKLLSLNLNVNSIQAIEGLDSNTALQELYLNDNKITSISGLSKLHDLRLLSLDLNRVANIDGLHHNTNLRSLYLSSNELSTLKNLENCCLLEYIKAPLNHITKIPSLSHLPYLQFLDLGRNQLSNIEGLSECNILSSLVLYSNKFTEMPRLNNALLRDLWLNGNRIKSIENLTWFPMLEHLSLHDNAISSIAPLTTCLLLKTLNLSFNQIGDIAELKHLAVLKRLESIQLNDNPVATSKEYKQYLILLLPSLREIDNELVSTDFKEKTIHTYYSKSGLMVHQYKHALLQENVHRHLKLFNGTSVHSWNFLKRLLISPTFKESWNFNTLMYFCISQKKERDNLITKHKRDNEKLNRSNLHEQDKHSILLSLKQQHSEEINNLLTIHYAQHKQYTPDTWRRKFVQNNQYWEAKEKRRKENAAVLLQAWWRRTVVKVRLAGLNRAAFTIQLAWRVYMNRKISKLHKMYTDAAIKIQKVWKGHRQHKKFQTLLEACRYEDEDDFDYGEIDESEFMVPEDLDLDFSFPSSLTVHNMDEAEEEEPFDLAKFVLKQRFISDEDKEQLVKEIRQPLAQSVPEEKREQRRPPTRDVATPKHRSKSEPEIRPKTPQQSLSQPNASTIPHTSPNNSDNNNEWKFNNPELMKLMRQREMKHAALQDKHEKRVQIANNLPPNKPKTQQQLQPRAPSSLPTSSKSTPMTSPRAVRLPSLEVPASKNVMLNNFLSPRSHVSSSSSTRSYGSTSSAPASTNVSPFSISLPPIELKAGRRKRN